MREQLWRYLLLDLWNQAPTPAKAARLRQTTIGFCRQPIWNRTPQPSGMGALRAIG